ncbi:MAG: hypothetical protein JXR96_01270 [Deltaproteobacteria bacterium]|nr:hypothetical protein [Deltaproteobacteria bacterium]
MAAAVFQTVRPPEAIRPASRPAPERSFSEVLDRAELSPGRPSRAPAEQSAADRVLGELDAGRRRLDSIIAQARSGRSFRPGELLAMQAEVYRIGEQVALTQRLVEAGTAGIRRLWTLQV